MSMKNSALAILALAVAGSVALAGEPGKERFRPVTANQAKVIELRVETPAPGAEAMREVKALSVYGNGKVVVWRRSFGGAHTVLYSDVLAAEELDLLHKFLIPRKAGREIHGHDLIGDEPSTRSLESGGVEIIVDYLIPRRADDGARDKPGKGNYQEPGTESFEGDAYTLPVKAEQKPRKAAAQEEAAASVGRESFKKPVRKSWSASDQVLVRALLHTLLATG